MWSSISAGRRGFDIVVSARCCTIPQKSFLGFHSSFQVIRSPSLIGSLMNPKVLILFNNESGQRFNKKMC
jgi:hypothetical protein